MVSPSPTQKRSRAHPLFLHAPLFFSLADPPGLHERIVCLYVPRNERKRGAAAGAEPAHARHRSLFPWLDRCRCSSSSASSPQPSSPSRISQAVAELPDRRSRRSGRRLGRRHVQGQERQQGELRRRRIHLCPAFVVADASPAAAASAPLPRLVVVVVLCRSARGVPAAAAAHEKAAAQARRVRAVFFPGRGQLDHRSWLVCQNQPSL